MAFTVPIYQQDKGYSALQDRQALAANVQPGAAGIFDFVCLPVGGSIRVTGGYAWVRGTNTPNQGVYGVFGDHSVQDVAVTAADAGLPRMDNVILRVYDPNPDAGSGPAGPAARAQLEYQVGVPQSGASLANLSAAPTPPANSLLLANVFAPAGSGSTPSLPNMVDRRLFSRGFYRRVERSTGSGGDNYPLVNPSPGSVINPIDAANLSIPFDTSGVNYFRTTFVCPGWYLDLIPAGGMHRNLTIGFYQDGAGFGWRYSSAAYLPSNAQPTPMYPIYAERTWKPAAGHHVIQPVASITSFAGGGIAVMLASPSYPIEFTVEEIMGSA
jgi:hypothetical protein